MAVSTDLTGALKKVVLELEDDLRVRVESDPLTKTAWQEEHTNAISGERTAMSWQAWRDDRLTQVAVAWVLASVSVRFCEDNRLVSPVWIAGPAGRRQEALDAELGYFRAHPEHTDREWLLQAINHLGSVKATRDLVDVHSPLWLVSPSGQAAKRLVDFWRDRTDSGELVRDFTDPELSTRFLGDLYQDLSDYAKKTFALLQTPDFVEEFILDQTMEAALAERPLDGFTLIDPTCGSGHFLLGAFARLNDHWAAHAPGLEVQQRVQNALDAIHGVDLNPFAVAIARFRLMVAALQACGLASLEDAPAFTFHLAAGDSLLHGRRYLTNRLDPFDDDAEISGFAYETEDLEQLRQILVPGRYDVVVGNPPYITVKDKTLNARYRDLYSDSCKGKYALSVPFMERFFELAKRPEGDKPAGWAGQITSNSFMKREFGSKLIEDYLVRQDLRLVVDTSGAYIPGHGTPTVIIVGRPQRPVGPTIKAVLGVRGEPGQPTDPAKGLVWSSVIDHISFEEFDDAYISVTSLDRTALATHPWSLSGGGAIDVVARIEGVASSTLTTRAESIGITSFTLEDEVYVADAASFATRRVPDRLLRPMVLGDGLRDWSSTGQPLAIWPYDSNFKALVPPLEHVVHRSMWPYRTNLSNSQMFGGQSKVQSGLQWTEFGRLTASKLQTPLSIAFAFVATHNHFVLDRGGKVFKQSAPVIKLPKEATEDDHLALLGVLNSSTACFWLKQTSHGKGNGGVNEGFRGDDWEEFFEFTGTTLKDFPLTGILPTRRGRLLDDLAQRLSGSSPAAVAAEAVPSADALSTAERESRSLRGQLVAQQEELDWEVYCLYGLIDEDLTCAGEDLPELALPEVKLGERAFEIALARRVEVDEEETAWFSRHGSTPITQIPSHWPAAYRDLVQRRLDRIESNLSIRLLEKPEHKRRWASEPWAKQVERALRRWLLDRLEDKTYWHDAQGRPAPKSIGQLADHVARDADLVSVLELWSGRKDQSVAASLTALLADESVPHLAAYRLKDTGLRKREAWEHTWDLQRRQDSGETVGTIPVPPKYTNADFRKASWWQHRGKLDVPKERFILYPDAGRETDPTPLLGWAGWDHAQQALALATIIGERESEGWDDERLLPLVAGLAELQPWVTQWHDEIDPAYGVNLAEFCAEQLRARASQVGATIDELTAWRPAATSRGRRKKESS